MGFGDVGTTSKTTGFGRSKQSSSGLDIESLAREAGIDYPKKKSKVSFQNLLNTLNAPSLKTEKFLTGGQGYKGTLSDVGIQAKEGQLDLNDILSFAGQMVLDPLNLIAPLGIGTKALKGLGAGAKAAGKIKPIGKAGRAAGKAFVPFYEAGKKSPQFVKELTALEKATRAKQIQAVRAVAKLGKDVPKDIKKDIGKLVEKSGRGEKLTAKEMKAVTEAKEFIEKRITAPEKVEGILPQELENYFPRKVDRDAIEANLKFGGTKLSLSKGGAEKTRKFVTQEAGEKAGTKYKDAYEALAIRSSKSEAARNNSKFLKRLIGGEVKDIDGNPLFRSIGKKEGLLPGYSQVRIDKSGLRVGDRFLGTYPAVSKTGKKIVGITSRKANYQVPTEIADELTKYYNTFTSDDAVKGFLKLYDSALGIWKGSVTSLFPAFHIRNVMGNLSNMWLGGFKNPTLLGSAAKIQTGRTVTAGKYKVTKEMVDEFGVTGRGQFGFDIPDVLGDTLGKKGIGAKVNILEHGRKVGTVLEENSKIAFFLDRLRKGDTPAQATAKVKKYLFDYSALTEFERKGMKRVIPFYTWMRNNIPLQLEALITQPGKQAAFSKTFTNLSDFSEEQKDFLPGYMKERLTLKLGEDDEGLKILTSIGFPFEDLARLTHDEPLRAIEKELFASTGPGGSIAGLVTNKDYFRGENIDELGYSYGFQSRNYPEFLKEWLEYREETTKSGKTIHYVNPQKYTLFNIFGSRIIQTLSDIFSDDFLERASKFETRLFPGVPRTLVPEEEKRKRKREQEEVAEEELIKRGKVKKFQRIYVPKEGGSSSGGFGSLR